MRRIITVIMLYGIIFMLSSCSNAEDAGKTTVKLYYADSELSRLLPYEDEIPEGDTGQMAQAALDKLTEGRDDNKKIRRLLPRRRLRVYVNGSIAYVDLPSDIAEAVPQSRDIERLIIYQITDTLTDMKGIRFVKFTVDGEERKELLGFFDMREAYKYRYPE